MKKLITLIALLTVFFSIDANAGWKPIGPTGSVKLLAKTSKNLFASDKYLFKSTDSGLTWDFAKRLGEKMYAENFIQFGDTLLIFFKNSNYKWFSSDCGETWKGERLSLECSIFFTFKVGNSIIQIDEPELKFYKSEDLGKTWTQIQSNFYLQYPHFTLSNNVFYCNNSKKCLYSTDTCKTWSEVPTYNYDNYFLANGDYMITAKYDKTIKVKNFFYSSNGGTNWEEYNWGILTPLNIDYVNILNGLLVVHTISGDYYTTDKGANWIEYIGEFAPLTENNRLELDNCTLAATNGGFYRKYKNDTSWNILSTNLDNVKAKELAVNNNILFAATSWNGLFKSYDFGKTWAPSNKGLKKDDLNSICFLGSHSFVSSQFIPYTIYRGDANGDNWKICENAPNNVAHEKFRVYAGTVYSCTKKGIYFSKDSGLNWSEFNPNFKIFSIKDIFVKDSMVLLASDSGLYRSSDFGKSYKLALSEPNYSVARAISEIDGTYFVPCGYSLYKSTDQGNTWKIVNWNKVAHEVGYGVEKHNNYLFLHTSIGVYYSIDFGDSWQYMGTESYGACSLICNNGMVYRTSDYWGGILEYKIPTEFKRIQLVSPENLAANIKPDSLLHWNELDNAVVYTLQVAKDIDFKDFTININCGSTYIFFDSLSPNTKYYWRVRAMFGDIKGEWSDTWSFTTAKSTGVSEEQNDLIYIYPNPATSNIFINNIDGANSTYNLEIINSLGEKLQRYTDLKSNSASELNVSQLSPGAYFIIVESGEKRIVKKLNITK